MNSFEEYLNQILQNIDASDETKRELYEEFLDHLEQLRKSYVTDGVQDAHAIKLAISDFGHSELVGGLINKAISQNRKWIQALVWFVFTSYALIAVYQLFLTQTRLIQHSMEQPHPNLIPFQSILQYANGYPNYNFDTWFFNLFGNVLLFVPLGFLLPILFAKARRFSTTIVWTILVSLTIELTQLGTRLGSFDVDDLILNVLGGLIGFAVWIMADVCWRITLQKLRPAIK
ncbi:VanZ family protein [Paenibacillus glycanilyticus]|uniref:VanZ family protein n=1 Tax=Paenibacillus glycanilyticus TaxID=126569 RepID=UPI00203F4F66|nr:VanZ family protein [Paenibacillus glycanilyticus]MCM3626250.1 VanZ family protein [Paenibacillus glycanilyticus]